MTPRTPERPFADPAQREISRRDLLRAGAAGGVLLGLGGVLAACSNASTPRGTQPAGSTSAASIKRGGVLTIGCAGGGAKDTLDAHQGGYDPDTARAIQLYDRLMHFTPDFGLEPELAESFEPNAHADAWTLRLRKGVTFHDGKPLTADDAIFTITRILDPKNPGVGAAGISYVDLAGMKKLDDLTVHIPLKTRNVGFSEQFAQYFMGVVPVGYDPAKPIGTGPFKYKSFTPGQQSVFTRNEHYWRDNEPYVDQVVIIDFPDDTARVNALLGGQVDAISGLPASQIPLIRSNSALQVLDSPTGAWLALAMRIDVAPFNDLRVRQAMRLLANRPQILSSAYSGEATLGNDLYGRFDASYATSLPQREQDIDQAKSLLTQAKQDVTVDIVTAESFPGMVSGATVFAQNASQAGVKVNVKKVDSSTLYGNNWLKWPFATDYWVTRSYLSQATLSSLPTSPWNETHWNNPTYNDLIKQAQGQPDLSKRTELLVAAQKLEYDQGGYIIPAFTNQVDAYSAKLTGFQQSKTGTALNNYTLRQVGFVA